jgi:lipopolysaccharide transport system permease protein
MNCQEARPERDADSMWPTVRIRPGGQRVSSRLRELWAYRELLYFLVWRDLKVRFKQTAIGAGWVLLQPLFTMGVFTLFFGLLAGIPSDGIPYPLFYLSALLPWTYFANALGRVTNTVVDHQHMITKIYFPRLILPLAAVLSPLVDFAVALPLLGGMLWYYGSGSLLAGCLLPLCLALALASALGVGLWLSALNAVYRDVRHAVPFLIQAWMFLSPVAYPSSLVPERWRWLYGLNPMAGVIEGFRWALAGRGEPPTLLLLPSVAVILFALYGGLVYFRRMEGTLADVV